MAQTNKTSIVRTVVFDFVVEVMVMVGVIVAGEEVFSEVGAKVRVLVGVMAVDGLVLVALGDAGGNRDVL